MTEPGSELSIFAGYGIELEYMIVDRQTLNILPIADELVKSVAGDYANDVEDGPIAWSNELVLHVIELKTNGPVADLETPRSQFLAEIHRVNSLLADAGGMLLPGAMHPWMNPDLETRLWPHGANEIYAAYNRIFDCRGHGWSNLQSMHLNLPFAGDSQFALLHAAIRILLPVMPALAASSPIIRWEYSGLMDTRLEVYRNNARRIPSITGQVIPEPAANRREYESAILAPIYSDIAPFDPTGILQHEWLNSRGAIARFDRSAVEIRVLDMQETPAADLAIAGAISDTLKAIAAGRWTTLGQQNAADTNALAAILAEVVREADEAVIRSRDYLGLFGFPERTARARELWQHLLENLAGAESGPASWRDTIDFILKQGCLARRIARAVGPACRRSHVEEAYRVLAGNLADGSLFEGIG